jgi:hypothetical protein
MGLSSERFCHAAIGRLMDGDRGHWFSLVHPCVWLGADHTFTPITHTHTHTLRVKKKTSSSSSIFLGASSAEKKMCRRPAARCPAQMMSRLFLPPTYRTPPSLSLLPSSLCYSHPGALCGGTRIADRYIYLYTSFSLYLNIYVRRL